MPSIDNSQCSTCLKDKTDGVRLQTCAGCAVVRYCSKACQKKDWTVHKWSCKSHQRLRERLGSEGSSIQDELTRWLRVHRQSLSEAFRCSLDIPSHPHALDELALTVVLNYLPNEPNLLKRFTVDRVHHTDLAHLDTHGGDFTQFAAQRKHYDNETKNTEDGYGTGLILLSVLHGTTNLLRGLPTALDKTSAAEPVFQQWETRLRWQLAEGRS